MRSIEILLKCLRLFDMNEDKNDSTLRESNAFGIAFILNISRIKKFRYFMLLLFYRILIKIFILIFCLEITMFCIILGK